MLRGESQWSLLQWEGEKLVQPLLCCRAGFIYPTLYLCVIEMHHALKAPFPSVKRDEGPLRCLCSVCLELEVKET